MSDLMEMVTAYQRTAIVAAACETGVADAIADAPATAAAVAAATGTHPAGVRALLGALVGTGLARREGDGYVLTDDGAPMASGHPASLARVVAKEWFFYGAWAGLPQTVRDGHARIAPWPERLAAEPAASLRFLAALDDLGAMFGGGLPAAAGLGPGRLLDAGGGTGVHAAALQRAVPGLRATVLDLPAVGSLTAELHPEVAFAPGDLFAPRLGRPEGEAWDAVLLGNILHDHPAGAAEGIVARAASLLAPGGTLVVYDWLLDEDGDGPPDVAMFALMMMVENEGGAAWTASRIEGWLAAAGLGRIATVRPGGPIGVVRGVRAAS